METTINAYLSFNGNCEEAFLFYKSVFRKEFTNVSRYKEIPRDKPLSEEEGNKIMHISLGITDDIELMGTDIPELVDDNVTKGKTITLSVMAKDEKETKRIFKELSKGGKIEMDLQETFWADLFGSFTDKYGIAWRINYGNGKSE